MGEVLSTPFLQVFKNFLSALPAILKALKGHDAKGLQKQHDIEHNYNNANSTQNKLHSCGIDEFSHNLFRGCKVNQKANGPG